MMYKYDNGFTQVSGQIGVNSLKNNVEMMKSVTITKVNFFIL
jgi:hypothetical protein